MPWSFSVGKKQRSAGAICSSTQCHAGEQPRQPQDPAQGNGNPTTGNGKQEIPGFAPAAHTPGPTATGDYACTQLYCL